MQPKKLYFLQNPIKNYVWGSPTILPTLLRYDNPTQEPQAELWMGSHPAGLSMIKDSHPLQSLRDLIASNPQDFLGEASSKKYGKTLPFLYKVLAINAPLSLQVHPNKKQAEAGFLAENQAGIDFQDPKRSYQDDNHKTELICAHSDDLWALCGFLPYQTIVDNFTQMKITALQPLITSFKQELNATGLKNFLKNLLQMPSEEIQDILQRVAQQLSLQPKEIAHWLSELIQRYPQDMASLAPLYMHVVHLPKGQAVFVENGILHAYLQGTGVEIMTLSDNVIRFGLTPKYVDMKSLEEVVRFEPSVIQFIQPDPHSGAFITPCDEFELAYRALSSQNPYQIAANNPAQIILALQGEILIQHEDLMDHHLKQGESIFIPYDAGAYTFSGEGEIFIASTPS